MTLHKKRIPSSDLLIIKTYHKHISDHSSHQNTATEEKNTLGFCVSSYADRITYNRLPLFQAHSKKSLHPMY